MAKRLDSRSLDMFAAVAAAGNFRHAADTLHMSQPPLSRAIRALEERLGVRLFDRDTQGVALTKAGRKLLPRAQRILRLIAEAEEAIAGDKDPKHLKIGITSAIELNWFSGLAARIGVERPALSVSSVSDTSPRLVRALRSHKLDAAIIALPTEVADLSVTSLDRQPMVVAVHSSGGAGGHAGTLAHAGRAGAFPGAVGRLAADASGAAVLECGALPRSR